MPAASAGLSSGSNTNAKEVCHASCTITGLIAVCSFVLFTCILYFSGLLGSGWFGCLFVLMYCKKCGMFSCIVHFAFTWLTMLWLAWLSYFTWFTWLAYSYSIRIVYLLQVVYAYSVYPSLCHCHTTDEPYRAVAQIITLDMLRKTCGKNSLPQCMKIAYSILLPQRKYGALILQCYIHLL